MAETPSLPGRPALTRAGGVNPFDVTAAEGEHYDAVRPSYPAVAVDWVLEGLAPLRGPLPAAGERSGGTGAGELEATGLEAGGLEAVELGAGTGLFTRLLGADPRVGSVRAVEPAAHMRAVLERDVAAPSRGRIVASPGTAEATGLQAGSADVVVAAQAWHWVDVPAASAEAARVLRPGGRLAAVWNQLDTAVPWVHRLTRIMHAGDVHAAAPEQRRFASPFGTEEHARWAWSLTMTPPALHALMASRSYWLRADERIRARMTANLAWYLHEHLGHGPEEPIMVPYVTVAWRAALR